MTVPVHITINKYATNLFVWTGLNNKSRYICYLLVHLLVHSYAVYRNFTRSIISYNLHFVLARPELFGSLQSPASSVFKKDATQKKVFFPVGILGQISPPWSDR